MIVFQIYNENMIKNVYNSFRSSLHIGRISTRLVFTFSSDILVHSKQFRGVRYVSNAFPIIFRKLSEINFVSSEVTL